MQEGARKISYYPTNIQQSRTLIQQLGLDEILDEYRDVVFSGKG
jgi:hypothetical protein